MSSMAYCARHVTTYLAGTGCLDCLAMQETPVPGRRWLPKFVADADELQLKDYYRIIKWRSYPAGDPRSLKVTYCDQNGVEDYLDYTAEEVERFDLRKLEANFLYRFCSKEGIPLIKSQEHLPPQVYVAQTQLHGTPYAEGQRLDRTFAHFFRRGVTLPAKGVYLVDEDDNLRLDTWRVRALYFQFPGTP